MGVFDRMEQPGYEQVVFCYDRPSKLKAIIAIHDTTLGPALGGCRMWPYKSEDEALTDVLRLARAMTLKAAAAGLNLGGGKAVIIGDSRKDKGEILFRAFGRMVESLHGRYITAEDVGTNVWDMDYISAETRYVTGLVTSKGGSGDPSPFTALGVYQGIRACLKEVFESTSLEGRRVAIQGVGSVGYHLARYVRENGGKAIISDINREAVETAVEEFAAEAVDPDTIYDVDCDVFAPCALGAVLNDRTIPRLRCRIVAGSANNQLDDEGRHGDELHRRGILYAPDFVINAGGLINVYEELERYNPERAKQKVSQLYDAIRQILAMAKKKSIPTHAAATQVAEERMNLLREVHRTYIRRN
jgi:leucine dehydrogenase